MTARVVVDASALLRVVVDEAGSKVAREWFHGALAAGEELIAPELIEYEVANIVARVFRDLSAAEKAYIHDLVLRSVRRERPSAPRVFEFAARYRLSGYDASYLALAKRENSPLVTADAALADAASREGVAVRRL